MDTIISIHIALMHSSIPLNPLRRKHYGIALNRSYSHTRQLANVAEVEINLMVRQCINRRIDSIDTQRSEVAAWQAARDQI